MPPIPRTATLASLTLALGSLAGCPAAVGAGRAGGILHYFETSTANGTGSAVVSGVFSDYGVDHEGTLDGGNGNEIVLQKGSFEVEIARLNHSVRFSLDPVSCVYRESGSAPTTLQNGTGAYAGIKGTVTITVAGTGILPRLADGKCNTTHTAAPLVALSTAQGSGRVSFSR
jgi:hypothetical protein